MPLFQNRYRYVDAGLLLLRVGLGVMFTFHGYPKLVGGPELWTGLGGVMKQFGISFAPAAWGFMAAVAEALGGQLLALGLFFRFTCLLLLITMIVAAASHIASGEGFNAYSHAVESAVVFLGLLLIGPGRFSLDQMLFPPPRRTY
jgi:putative oxidoreductase